MMLQERVRADRHATSYPLIVVGAVGFHYASTGLFGWISVIYGIPLAFVIVWMLQRRTEKLDGVGMGDDEALLIAFGVFLASSLFASQLWLSVVPNQLADNLFFWSLLPVAVGLAAIAARQRNRQLFAWSAVVVAGLALAEALNEWTWDVRWSNGSVSYRDLVAQLTFLAVTIAGVLANRRERALAES